MNSSFHVSAGTTVVLQSGRALIEQYYGNEPFGWRESGPSLSALSERHGVCLSVMYRCLSTASVWMQCGAPELQHLTLSHLRELVSVDPDLRSDLLGRAEREGWSVSRLRRECDEDRNPEAPLRGRPRRSADPDFARRAVRSWVSTPERLAGFEGLRSLGDRDRNQMLKAVNTMILELEMMRYRLEA